MDRHPREERFLLLAVRGSKAWERQARRLTVILVADVAFGVLAMWRAVRVDAIEDTLSALIPVFIALVWAAWLLGSIVHARTMEGAALHVERAKFGQTP